MVTSPSPGIAASVRRSSRVKGTLRQGAHPVSSSCGFTPALDPTSTPHTLQRHIKAPLMLHRAATSSDLPRKTTVTVVFLGRHQAQCGSDLPASFKG
ncbi:hypothetical protein [Limnobaculum xujianqingii]|uniref:hypothetical protein n=1 Tax=Limnobaculum xujianqingii TaxID=2738837 RepID=UPI00112CDDA7|nr:hypothetical protein [Limnobaculum xujianqingii]